MIKRQIRERTSQLFAESGEEFDNWNSAIYANAMGCYAVLTDGFWPSFSRFKFICFYGHFMTISEDSFVPEKKVRLDGFGVTETGHQSLNKEEEVEGYSILCRTCIWALHFIDTVISLILRGRQVVGD